MNFNKIILINGPPRSGKDHIVRCLLEHPKSPFSLKYSRPDGFLLPIKLKHMKFADPLKAGALALLGYSGLNVEQVRRLSELLKDKPQEKLNGKTLREFLIYLSEETVKPFAGKNFFGRIASSVCDETPYTIFSDSGFIDETQAVVDHFGEENVLLIRLHRDGETFSKLNDSRSYINLDGVETWNYTNDGGENELLALAHLIFAWGNGHDATDAYSQYLNRCTKLEESGKTHLGRIEPVDPDWLRSGNPRLGSTRRAESIHECGEGRKE